MTNLVRNSLKVADPDVARVQDGAVLQGRAVGTTTVQVSHRVLCVSLQFQSASQSAVETRALLDAGAVPSDIIGPGREEHQGAG